MIPHESVVHEPSLAILEVASIARGYIVLDAACKRASVRCACAEPITPGKFWIALRGREAETYEALHAGIDAAGAHRIDHAYLPAAHVALLAAIESQKAFEPGIESVGAMETSSIASTVRACDAALKAASVRLAALHLARGIGGKGYFVLSGSLSDVIASIEAASEAAGTSWIVGREIVANPDDATAHAARRR